ncbi:hypothetical protein K439DRAFT_1638132 [Ramaria rubella]|nr:hypothetical protein K439DRAFT_1638132 [Ramaria rubella]
MDPQAPTVSLPLLRNIALYTPNVITASLINLRALYWPAAFPPTSATIRASKRRIDQRIPDSGYASAEEDEGEDTEAEERIMLLRADGLERAFAVRWLTGFIARSEEWIAVDLPGCDCQADMDKERESRACIVEEAATLLALSADTQTDEALAREFTFAVTGGEEVIVKLKDESYDQDHEGVGLQTWGSACVMAGRLCKEPDKYLALRSRVGDERLKETVRVLELGAGTGLLSMVVAKLQDQCWARDRGLQLDVVATDFHPAVLKNLRGNVARNFSCSDAVQVEKLDWADTPIPKERDKFDVVLAADVIYDERHAGWIRNCAERMLRREQGSLMWLIIPRRPTRTGEVEGVDGVFGGEGSLRILHVEDVARCNGVGRADEDGYRLFCIGWTP